jgi:hypothetical protein
LIGTVVDPRTWLTVRLDRDTVRTLRSVLQLLGENETGAGLRELVEDWLAATET